MLDYTLLPKKLNEICLFKKKEKGCVMYSYGEKITERENIIICKLEDLEIERDFCVSKNAVEMVKRLQATDVKITDKSFIIKSAKGKYTAKLVESELPQAHVPSKKTIELDIEKLNKACNYVATSDNQPILKGVYCNNAGDIIATDSYKAYIYVGGMSISQEEGEFGVSIPTTFIKLVSENLGNERCIARFDEQTIAIAKGNTVIIGNLYAGNYPSMQGIVAKLKAGQTIHNIDSAEVLDFLDIAKNCENSEDKQYYIKFTNNHIEASGVNTFESEINIELEEGYKIILNGKNVSEALKSLNLKETCDMNVAFNHDTKTANMVLIKGEDENESVLIIGVRE